MKKQLTDEQRANAQKIFKNLIQKKQQVLNELDQKLDKIFKEYKNNLEEIANKNDKFNLEEEINNL